MTGGADLEAAYIAGLFDGEGCVCLTSKVNNNGQRYHSMQLYLTNTDRDVLEWVQERCGGSLHGPFQHKPQHRPGFRIQWAGRAITPFLRLIQPYVRIKREAVEIGLRFRESVEPNAVGTPRDRVTPEIIEDRNALQRRLNELNGHRQQIAV